MKFKWWFFLVAPPAIVLFGWIFGEVVMHLWNWLMPMLFGLHAITFWQGIGLLILCLGFSSADGAAAHTAGTAVNGANAGPA